MLAYIFETVCDHI